MLLLSSLTAIDGDFSSGNGTRNDFCKMAAAFWPLMIFSPSPVDFSIGDNRLSPADVLLLRCVIVAAAAVLEDEETLGHRSTVTATVTTAPVFATTTLAADAAGGVAFSAALFAVRAMSAYDVRAVVSIGNERIESKSLESDLSDGGTEEVDLRRLSFVVNEFKYTSRSL